MADDFVNQHSSSVSFGQFSGIDFQGTIYSRFRFTIEFQKEEEEGWTGVENICALKVERFGGRKSCQMSWFDLFLIECKGMLNVYKLWIVQLKVDPYLPLWYLLRSYRMLLAKSWSLSNVFFFILSYFSLIIILYEYINKIFQ